MTNRDALIKLTPAEEIEYATQLAFDVEWFDEPCTLRSEFLFSKYEEMLDKVAHQLWVKLGEDAPDDVGHLYAEANRHLEVCAIIDRIPEDEWKRLLADRIHIPVECLEEFYGLNVPKIRIN